jgi:phosphatidylglycerophosphatase A
LCKGRNFVRRSANAFAGCTIFADEMTQHTWQKWVGTVGGTGYLPVAPGTWGTAAGILFLLPFYGSTGEQMLPGLIAASILSSIIGAKAAHDLSSEWGEDPKPFVLDEVAGLWVTMIGHTIHAPNLIIAFFLFRLFDIFKPLGIRRLENISGGWGVMLDDLAAGVCSNVVLWIIGYYL